MNTLPRIPPIEGGFSEGLFHRTAKRLMNDRKAFTSVIHFGLKGKMQRYRSIIDFLICEVWHLPWKTRCTIYYRDSIEKKTIPKAVDDEALLTISTQYDVTLAFLVLDRLMELKEDHPETSWRTIRKMVKEFFHLERGLAKYIKY